MILIRAADTPNNGACLFPHIVGLLASRRLHRVGVGVQGHDLVADVVLDEAQRLSRRRVIAVKVRLLTKHRP